MDVLSLNDFEHEPYELDRGALRMAVDEDPFGRAAFELHKDLAQSATLVAGAFRVDDDGLPRSLTLDEAVLAGLMVRCLKTQHGVLQSAASQRQELVNFFLRALAESAVNLSYLLQCGSPELYESFRRYSLRVDAALKRRIEENVAARDGELWPIERRMLEGIQRVFARSGVDPADVDPDDRRDWGESIYRRFVALGLRDIYLAFFSVQSHYTHGNWHDLYAYHLTYTDSGAWLPALHFSPIRPQSLTAALVPMAVATESYLLDVASPSADRDRLQQRIHAVRTNAEEVDRLHEAWLGRRAAEGE
jgi:hypothetical protein